MLPVLAGIQAGAALLQQINNLNETTQRQGEEVQDEEVIDPRQDTRLERQNARHENLTAHLKIGLLDIEFKLDFGREKEATNEIGLKAQNERNQIMEGSLGKTKEDDKSGTFPSEEWKTVQENRDRCVAVASKGKKAHTAGSAQPEMVHDR